MMVSTKGRYALRVMIDLAEHQAEGYIPLKAIARRQGKISGKHFKGAGPAALSGRSARQGRWLQADPRAGNVHRG